MQEGKVGGSPHKRLCIHSKVERVAREEGWRRKGHFGVRNYFSFGTVVEGDISASGQEPSTQWSVALATERQGVCPKCLLFLSFRGTR